MGIEGFDGSDYFEKQAAESQFNKYEASVGEAGSVDSNFGKFEDGGFVRVDPGALEMQSPGSPTEYGGVSPSDMQEQFRKFYEMDGGQTPWDQATIDAFFGDGGVTLVQDGDKNFVSAGHERLRYAQETHQPYLPAHVFKTHY